MRTGVEAWRSRFQAVQRWGGDSCSAGSTTPARMLGSRKEWEVDGPSPSIPKLWSEQLWSGQEGPSKGSGHILNLQGVCVTSSPAIPMPILSAIINEAWHSFSGASLPSYPSRIPPLPGSWIWSPYACPTPLCDPRTSWTPPQCASPHS